MLWIGETKSQTKTEYGLILQSRTKLDGTPCRMSEKRLFLSPFLVFNVAVVLLTYNIDLGDGVRGKVTLPN